MWTNTDKKGKKMGSITPDTIYEKCPLVYQEEVGAGIFFIAVKSTRIKNLVVPGQFAMVRGDWTRDPLLARPFSFSSGFGLPDPSEHDCDCDSNCRETKVSCCQEADLLYFLIKVKGRGTRLLQRLEGGSVSVLGPIGGGFDLQKFQQARRVHLLAGGIGVAPLLTILEWRYQSVSSNPFANWTMFVGAAEEQEIPEISWQRFVDAGLRVDIATDDGSRGLKGDVCQLWQQHLQKKKDEDLPEWTVCCGPEPMTDAVVKICEQRSLKGEASLEAPMACGMGVCLGCMVVGSNGEYLQVCKEGPVFSFDSLGCAV